MLCTPEEKKEKKNNNNDIQFYYINTNEIRLQNSQFFSQNQFLLSVFSLVPDLLFDCSHVLGYAKIRTVLQSKEIPGELSRENLISSHVKITCYLDM